MGWVWRMLTLESQQTDCMLGSAGVCARAHRAGCHPVLCCGHGKPHQCAVSALSSIPALAGVGAHYTFRGWGESWHAVHDRARCEWRSTLFPVRCCAGWQHLLLGESYPGAGETERRQHPPTNSSVSSRVLRHHSDCALQPLVGAILESRAGAATPSQSDYRAALVVFPVGAFIALVLAAFLRDTPARARPQPAEPRRYGWNMAVCNSETDCAGVVVRLCVCRRLKSSELVVMPLSTTVPVQPQVDKDDQDNNDEGTTATSAAAT